MDVPYLFFLNGHEIKTTIEDCMNQMFQLINTEKTVPIVYQPQAIFRFEFHVLNFYELKKKLRRINCNNFQKNNLILQFHEIFQSSSSVKMYQFYARTHKGSFNNIIFIIWSIFGFRFR